MRKLFLLMTGFILLLSFVAAGWAEEAQQHGIMQPDEQTRQQWYNEVMNAPAAYIDPQIAQTLDWGPRPYLLDKLTYTPSERNQGSCGNCWVWAGTAQLEILHTTMRGANERLSTQFFNSCFNNSFSWTDGNGTHNGYYACAGGNLGNFVVFYNSLAYWDYIPWSNTSAYFQDAGWPYPTHTSSSVACNAIGLTPAYGQDYNTLIATTVNTIGVGQAAAIANIKNVLAQNKAVQFNFWLPNGTPDWTAFYNFWDNSNEATIWNPDVFCGDSGNACPETNCGAGHAVTIVGWNDDDPNNPYWIVLNSWGSNAGRPKGLFRMKMNMNYDCIETVTDHSTNPPTVNNYYDRTFQTLNTQGNPFYDANSLYMAAKGGSTNNIWFRKKNHGATSWGSWTQLDGTTSHSPSMATFNSRLYMAAKGVVTPKVYVRSMNYQGTWTAWSEVPGGSTSAGPILVTYRNRLYAFAKGATTSKIWYNSMGTNGVWSGWLEVAGASAIDSPAVVVLNDQLVMYQVDGTGHIYVKLMSSDGSWSGWYEFAGGGYEMQTDAGVSATVFNNSAVIVVKGLFGTPYANTISTNRSWEGDPIGYYGWTQVPGGTTTSRPQIAWGPTPYELYVTAKGSATSVMWENHYDSIEQQWSGWSQSAGGSTHAPSVNTYYFGTYSP